MTDTARLHTEQVEYWNGPGAQRWVAQQDSNDMTLAPFGEAALARAAVKAGESVIEIGCGCGSLSVELSKRVGPTGEVVALDVSAPMLAVTRERLAPFPNARAVQADAATHAFEPGSADLLFSRFGVMFFGDPTAAFRNMRAALKPSGRVIFAVWRGFAENLWMKTPYKAVLQHVPPMKSPEPDDPGPFSFGDESRVTRILTSAGFRVPNFEKFDIDIDLGQGGGIDAATESALSIGPAARAMEGQPDAVRRAAAASIREALLPYADGNTVKLPAAIWIVSTTV